MNVSLYYIVYVQRESDTQVELLMTVDYKSWELSDLTGQTRGILNSAPDIPFKDYMTFKVIDGKLMLDVGAVTDKKQ